MKARDLADLIKSPFLLWCKYHAPQDRKDPPSEYQKMLMEKGRTHETNVVKTLFPLAESVEFTTQEETFRKVLSLLKEGAEIIHGASLIEKDLIGVADILEKKDGTTKEQNGLR